MADMDTKSARRRNKRWPDSLKREIVAASLEPGTSVSVVARQYDVNANQVFSWRRLYRQAPGEPSSPPAPQLVPVTIATEPVTSSGRLGRAAAETIEIEVSSTYRIRVGASFDARALARVLDVLSRAGGGREKRR
jgi:transposase